MLEASFWRGNSSQDRASNNVVEIEKPQRCLKQLYFHVHAYLLPNELNIVIF